MNPFMMAGPFDLSGLRAVRGFKTVLIALPLLACSGFAFANANASPETCRHMDIAGVVGGCDPHVGKGGKGGVKNPIPTPTPSDRKSTVENPLRSTTNYPVRASKPTACRNAVAGCKGDAACISQARDNFCEDKKGPKKGP